MLYLARGTQIDGEHEYFITAILQADHFPSDESAQIALIKEHAFGYDEDEEQLDPDTIEYFRYGDGLTRVELDSIDEITEKEHKVLKKFRVTY